jgi:ABC-type multidrug transport system fused ATPase/permease subunit
METVLQVMTVLGVILTALSPVIVIILTILMKRGKVTKEQKEEIEEVLGAVTSSIDKFKTLNKSASKELTGVIKDKVLEIPKTGEALDSYLIKFGLNKKD